MNVVSINPPNTHIQLGLFEHILGLLPVEPIFLIGIVLIGILLAVLFKKNNLVSKTAKGTLRAPIGPFIRTGILSLLLYYYVWLVLENIVGMPTLHEYMRLSRLGETFFHPDITLIPFRDGISLSFILNIFLFIPLGFLCPLISKTYERARNTLLIGLCLSSLIEISQMFTLYRATDINDLLTNVLGTLIGYLCFRLIARLRIVKQHTSQRISGWNSSAYLPITIIMIAAVLGFFS